MPDHPPRVSVPAVPPVPPVSRGRTRLAPSPTGSLHIGHARTFLLTWALARHEGWEIVLRMEDLDRDRVKPGAIAQTRTVLDWLGLVCDGAMTVQSDHPERFRAALERLAARGLVFRCERSRKDVRSAASAPHREDGEVRFPPSLRPAADDRPRTVVTFEANHRLLVDPAPERVEDELHGALDFDPGSEVGDFLVWTRLGVPSYQLAVVVDDIHQGVTDVVRGEDLLSSAARQQLLHRALLDDGGRATIPRWWHLPLVHDRDGARLAKRRGDLALNSLRAAGVRPERIIGLVAAWCGWLPARSECSLTDFQSLVAPDTLRAVVCRERDPTRRCIADEDSIGWLLTT